MKPLINAFLLALFSAAVHVHAASGELDPSFARTGMARLGFGFGEDQGNATAVQADGKVVIAGASGPFTLYEAGYVGGHFSLARLHTNGSPDFSFGLGGTVMTRVSSLGLGYSDAAVKGVKIQADGKIVAAGYACTRSNHFDFTIVRYNSDGSIDTTFGTTGTGIVYTDFGEGSMARDVVIQADGKIVVVGHTLYEANAGEGAVALARYLTNGVLDGSFGNGGKQITTGVTGYTGAHAATIQPDGKILAVGIGIGSGHGGIDFGLYRYTTNGVLDGEFGGGSGKVFTAITTNVSSYNYFDSANAVMIQPGNFTVQNPDKILVVGTYWNMNAPGHKTMIAMTRYSMNGTLDSTFGNGGIVTNAIGTDRTMGHAILMTGGFVSRRILVAGTSVSGGKGSFLLARYTLGGVLDGTFNGTGYVTTSVGSSEDWATAMAHSGGRIVVAGSTRVNQYDTDFAVVRYNADGSPDNSFHHDGIGTIGVADHSASAKGVATQPDGKAVIAGYAYDGTKEVVALMRLNPDGLPDTTFGVNGKVTTAIGANARANAVAIQSDGKIVAAGVADDDFTAVRYHPNGDPDNSFGFSGIARTPIGTDSAEATALVLQPDGKVVVAGMGYNGIGLDFAVVRYTTNGLPDSSFDMDGKILTPIGAGHDLASAVRVQADGKIVVAGSSVIGTGTDISLVRYHTNGLLDHSFGTLGRVVTDVGIGSLDYGQCLAIQPNGRILVGGLSAQGAITFAAVRYHTNGLLDMSFDGDGKVTTPVGLGSDDRGFAMALQTDGKIVLAGTSTAGGPQFSAVRYKEDGSLDDSYGFGGKVITQFDAGGENIGYAVALDSMGRAVIAGDANGLFGVARLQGDPILTIRSIVRRPDGQVVVEGLGIPGVTHTIQAAADLGTFLPVGTVVPDGLGVWQYQHSGAVGLGKCFYRISNP